MGKRLPVRGSIGEPIWCSMCGDLLTKSDHPHGDGWACQCEQCRRVLNERVRHIMKQAGIEV